MNVQQLRDSLKRRWLTYYCNNRDWLVHLAIWVDDAGQRRPSSSFILGTLSVLEPRLTQLLPLIVGLNNSPDRIITVLGLNVSPDDALKELEASQAVEQKMLPAQSSTASDTATSPLPETASDANAYRPSKLPPNKVAAQQDEGCGGRHGGHPRDR